MNHEIRLFVNEYQKRRDPEHPRNNTWANQAHLNYLLKLFRLMRNHKIMENFIIDFIVKN